MLSSLLSSAQLAPPLEEAAGEALAGELAATAGWRPYPRSLAAVAGALFFIGRRGREKRLCVLWPAGLEPALAGDFHGERTQAAVGGLPIVIQAGPLDHANASGLRVHLQFTAPRLVGTRAAFGAGDRLGLATPAHVQALRGLGLAAIFAQQSVREMSRTGRTPEQVLDSATFGVLEQGWREGYGADADHLKTIEDADATAAAGFTMFTVDPGDHVDGVPGGESAARAKFEALPWGELETTSEDMRRAYVGRTFRLPGDLQIGFDDSTLVAAAVKYGRALAHTAAMYRHLAGVMGRRPFELEMSVDETDSPTTAAEHLFVARELRRLGVRWVSLAPRFVGRFEKGVDYLGDLGEFERCFAEHVAVARRLGPYKISIHSGSDKFSIYPIAARLAGGLVHLKTAGTSYLEALRAVARAAPALFREVLDFAIARYPEDRASYHVSADPGEVPTPESLADDELPGVLDHFHARQVLHVTFGSVVGAEDAGRPRLRDRLLETLADNEEAHYEAVAKHIERHARPFAEGREGLSPEEGDGDDR